MKLTRPVLLSLASIALYLTAFHTWTASDAEIRESPSTPTMSVIEQGLLGYRVETTTFRKDQPYETVSEIRTDRLVGSIALSGACIVAGILLDRRNARESSAHAA